VLRLVNRCRLWVVVNLNKAGLFGLAAQAGWFIFGFMGKQRVVFKIKRIAEGDWQIEAHYAGAEVRYIKGLKSKTEVDDWLQGPPRIDWLRSQGYAK
jgi:hypothetical protein